MARHSQPQNQSNWNLLILKDKNSSVWDDRNNMVYNRCLKWTVLLWLFIFCFFPARSQAAGSFGTYSGFYGEKSQAGFATLEDAATWAWPISNPAAYPGRYSEGGVVYFKIRPDDAPPAHNNTNYWWGYYYLPTGKLYPYYPIVYWPNIMPPSKNFGSNQNLCVGNPIHIGIGEKYQIEKDYAGTNGLYFTRYYHSSVFAPKGSFGLSWRNIYDRKISALNTGTYSFAYITRARSLSDRTLGIQIVTRPVCFFAALLLRFVNRLSLFHIEMTRFLSQFCPAKSDFGVLFPLSCCQHLHPL